MGPAVFSWQAAAPGNTAAMMSSASMRWMGGGLRFPPRLRSTTRARLRFQRQRAANMGESSTAWVSTSSTESGCRNWGTSLRGKLWWGPSDKMMALSLAAAWSSKSKRRQRRLRSARPKARLMRPP